jgi:hypothetical protein
MAAAKGNKPSEFLKENRWIPLTLILRFLPHQAPTEDDSSKAQAKLPTLITHTQTKIHPSSLAQFSIKHLRWISPFHRVGSFEVFTWEREQPSSTSVC